MKSYTSALLPKDLPRKVQKSKAVKEGGKEKGRSEGLDSAVRTHRENQNLASSVATSINEEDSKTSKDSKISKDSKTESMYLKSNMNVPYSAQVGNDELKSINDKRSEIMSRIFSTNYDEESKPRGGNAYRLETSA